MTHPANKKNPVDRIQFRMVLAAFSAIFLIGFASCGKKNDSETQKKDASADLDLEAIQQQYQTTDHYSDQAKVILQYSLSGAPFEEVHPYSSKLVRSQSTLLHRFRCEISANSMTALCRVLDSSSHNLGGQVLVGQQPLGEFLSTLNADSIGRHFLMGSDDIPWNKNIDAGTVDSIAGLPRLLFEGNPPQWFSSSKLKETSVVMAEGVQYVDAVFESDHGPIACRIDSQKKTIVGIRLPRGLLAKEISSAADVAGVSFAILFQELTFDNFSPTNLTLQPDEKPVSEFVKLPEDFPSQTIGTPFQSWDLLGIDGRRFDLQSAFGAPALFIYGVKQQLTSQEKSQIDSLSKEYSFANFAWINPPGIPLNNTGFQFSRMGYFSDAKGRMLQAVEPGSSIFYLITNASGEIQFVSKRKKNWLDKVGPTLKRVQAGDDVAKEMHNEYAKYFEEYQNKLRSVSVTPNLAN